MKFQKIILFLLLVSQSVPAQLKLIRGTVFESDSVTPMPFVYIINKSNGNGTTSDHEGRFTLFSDANDTLVCSYVGARSYQPVSSLIPDSAGKVRLVMKRSIINLAPVTVSVFKIPAYEREYMKKVVDNSRVKFGDYSNSPITALYMMYSKEGRQIRKLAKIFEQIFIDEEVEKKLSPEILRRLTGDEKVDFADFRKYAYDLSDQFILTHEGADLYNKVLDCYKRYKKEGR